MTTRPHATLYLLGGFVQRQMLARFALGLILCSSLLSGCEPFRWSKQRVNVAWDIRVTSSDRPGQYAIAGRADLPNRTPLTIIAVRYLHANDANSVALNADPTYSILAYSPAEVVDGQWQTRLNLWQVAPDGRYQEAWQLEQRRLNLTLKPDADVVFLALLSPIYALPKLERSLEKEGLRLPEQTLRTTLDGERFAQVNQSLEIALPVGKTAPTIPALDDRNDGWGSRYLIPKEPQNPIELSLPETRQTDAPPRTAEFLR
jgi:hypothetical protein